MGIWEGMGKSPIFGGGAYLGVGVHHLRIGKALVKPSTKNKGEWNFIVEFEVVRSNQADHEEGSARSWIVNLKYPSSFSNIKKFVMAATDYTEADLQDDKFCDQVMTQITAEDNPLMGVEVTAEGRIVKTGKGGDFTAFEWEPVDAVQQPQAATA